MLLLSLYLCEIETKEERDKLAVIYETYLDAMTLTARKYVGSYQVEEDIVHNAILRIVRYLDTIDLSNTLSTKSFVCTVTRHCAIDWLRNKNLENTPIEEIAYTMRSNERLPVEYVMSDEGYNKLVDCIHSLSDIYREVCDLRFICGMRETEIADLLGITPTNVSVRVARGRAKLIEMLKEEGYDVKK